jgi:hypothetical protein
MGGEGRLQAERRSPRCTAGPEAAAQPVQKGRPAGREARREAGADDRKEGTMETMEEQRAFYMWTKRRGDAKPDGAG